MSGAVNGEHYVQTEECPDVDLAPGHLKMEFYQICGGFSLHLQRHVLETQVMRGAKLSEGPLTPTSIRTLTTSWETEEIKSKWTMFNVFLLLRWTTANMGVKWPVAAIPVGGHEW